MPWKVGQELQLPFIYNVGQATGLILTIIFSATASAWASAEAARTYLALQVIEAILSREQKLSALGGLAAAAAHELGTPLATISVVAKELARDLGDGPQKDDAWLLVAQAQRCRDILKRLTDKPELADALHERMSLLQLVTDVVEPWAGKSDLRVEALVWGPPGAAAPEIWRQPEIAHALTTIVENAFDFARSEILVTARFGDKSIAVEVRDDGPGFAPEILARLGEPYVTSRPGPEQSRTGHTGLGLGFFIAKTLLERTHAQVRFRNGPSGGAIVTARWQRSDIQAEEFENEVGGQQARISA